MNKILNLAFLLTSILGAAFNVNPIGAEANDNFQIGGNGSKIIYDGSKNSGDYAWISVDKGIRISTNSYQDYFAQYVVLGFDAPEIQDIVRMGFYVEYKKPNFFENIGNNLLEIFGNPPQLGTLTRESVLVKSDVNYSFFGERNYISIQGGTKADYSFPAIGRVETLLATEQKFKTDFANKGTTYPGTVYSNRYRDYFSATGGYFYNFDYRNSLNDESKSFTNRQFYAIVPYKWTDEIQPESIQATDIYSNVINDGLDANGNPYKDPISGDFYIDLTVSKDVGIAVNGINAKVTRIAVSGYTQSNDTAVLIENADFDYSTQKTINTKNQSLFVTNKTVTLNWNITNDNRYVFIKFMADSTEEAELIKVRVYYHNDNQKPAWIIRIKDDHGFLPPPYETAPIMNNDPTPGMLILRLVIAIIIGIILGVIAYYVVKFIKAFKDLVTW